MSQRKLIKTEIDYLQNAIEAIIHGCCWDQMPGGVDRWQSVYDDLRLMLEYGTNDGKPYVEPPLTDEDAIQRIPVMVRDLVDSEWMGPYVLLAVAEGHYKYGAKDDYNEIGIYHLARRLTQEEQAAWRAKK